MRRALVLLLLFGAPALPASATEVNPALLVLQEADVPYGLQPDADDTFVHTNASAAKGADARTRALHRRSGRITGYQAGYDVGDTTVRSRAGRYDRIYAGVAAWGVTKARTIAMARTQQRRIAAALR